MNNYDYSHASLQVQIVHTRMQSKHSSHYKKPSLKQSGYKSAQTTSRGLSAEQVLQLLLIMLPGTMNHLETMVIAARR